MHPIFNPQNLLGKPLLILFHKNFCGEKAKLVDIGEERYKFEFERFPENDEEDAYIWTDQEPSLVENGMAHFTTIGETHFYVKIEEAQPQEEQEQKLEYNSNMKTTVKELSDKLGVDVVYINGFLKTLEKLGKATVVGKVERPAGTKGKPASIYEINPGIVE